MSKSLGNYIGISEDATTIFGKVMSIPDSIMWRYFELLSNKPLGEIDALKAKVEAGLNPRDVKFELAVELTDRFHGVVPVIRRVQHLLRALVRRQCQQIYPCMN